jgi:hypothetical protein
LVSSAPQQCSSPPLATAHACQLPDVTSQVERGGADRIAACARSHRPDHTGLGGCFSPHMPLMSQQMMDAGTVVSPHHAYLAGATVDHAKPLRAVSTPPQQAILPGPSPVVAQEEYAPLCNVLPSRHPREIYVLNFLVPSILKREGHWQLNQSWTRCDSDHAWFITMGSLTVQSLFTLSIGFSQTS